ncbi:MAG TPA: hypothetical protein DEP33_07405 [Alteromonas sp.]|nr:hypothetical protein [Alteromonas sp.]HCB09616.1 hypothetical protein [Alteromonas sp.]HCL12486.1 hypothetical protein [Alteromonas sp.]|tara:strand:- start:23704 stop:25077 length:1374 start_codon:yes stop_codon:yes gene_type:complete
MRRIIGSLLALSCITAYPVHANDEDKWWFDIEVMLFARDTAVSDMAERFERQQVLSTPNTDWDLLTEYYQPDITMVYNSLPVCNAPTSPLWAEAPSQEEILREYYIEPEPEEPALDDQAGLVENGQVISDEPFVLADEAAHGIQASENTFGEPEPDIIPPAPGAIAAYWLSFNLNEQQLSPVRVKRRPLNCVTPTEPSLNPQSWQWPQPDLYVPPRQQTPLYVHGADFKRANGPHLLPTNQLTQDDIYTSIRWRKGIERLAHFSWRQQVKFGQDKAETLRLFAGQNFAQQFTQNGDLRPQQLTPGDEASSEQNAELAEPEDTFFAELNQRLSNPQPISFAGMMAPPETNDDGNTQSDIKRLSPIWELDGFIQIYLKYINRVPYLHINSELFYRQPVLSATSLPGAAPAYELVSIPFSQQRRVISTQLHYFDHPLFGMLVQIRRYDRPAAPQPAEEQD